MIQHGGSSSLSHDYATKFILGNDTEVYLGSNVMVYKPGDGIYLNIYLYAFVLTLLSCVFAAIVQGFNLFKYMVDFECL